MLNLKQFVRLRDPLYVLLKQSLAKTSLKTTGAIRYKPTFFYSSIGLETQTKNNTIASKQEELKVAKSLEKIIGIVNKNKAKDSLVSQRIVMELQSIFMLKNDIINDKESAHKLLKILVKLQNDHRFVVLRHTKANDVDYFEISEEKIPDLLSTYKSWEKVLLEANQTINDHDLLLETVYQVSSIFSENIQMRQYLEKHLEDNINSIPISTSLFFLNKILLANNKLPRAGVLINVMLSKYEQIKTNLFDLAIMSFIYYQALCKHASPGNNTKWRAGQHFGLASEVKFRNAQKLDLSAVAGERDHPSAKFSEMILEDAFSLVRQYESGELQIEKKEFMQGLIMLFKCLSRFSIVDKRLCKLIDKYVIEYQGLLSPLEKLTLLTTYAKYLNIIPEFAAQFEQDLYNLLRSFSFDLKHSLQSTLRSSMRDSVTSNKEYYDHLKRRCQKDGKYELPLFFESDEEMFPLGIEQLYEIYWYLGKMNVGDKSEELIEMSNSLVNLLLNNAGPSLLCEIIQSACYLSLTTRDGFIDWHNDIKFKLNAFLRRNKALNIFDERILGRNRVSFYRILTFINLKYGIDLIKYISQREVKHLQQEWSYSISNPAKSNTETRILNIIKNYFRDNNIMKYIQQNKLVSLHMVDIFIEPNVIIEINGPNHFLKDSSLEIMKNNHLPNFLMKSAIHELEGYKLILFDWKDLKDILEDEKAFEQFVIDKLKAANVIP